MGVEMGYVRGVLAVLVALLSACALTAPAQAQPATPIEVLSPERGSFAVGQHQKVRVRVRLAPGVSKLRAVVSGRRERVVTSRFRAGRRARVRVATLRLGRELSPGPGAIRLRGRLRGRRVVGASHFWVASRRADLAGVRVPRTGSARPLRMRVRTARRVDDVRIRVNGRNARGHFTRTVGGLWRGSLSASAGLHFGRNRISVTAFTRRGEFERMRRVVRVKRGRPFPGAGRDLTTKARQTVRLDGRSTLPRKDERLRFTWHLVSRPKGSRTRLRSPHAVRPRLRTDRPGTYRLRLRVRPKDARTASSAAAAGSDTVSVSAQPAVAPTGIPVQTIQVDGRSRQGIQVGSSFYPMSDGDAFQLLLLDGGTLEPLQNLSLAADDVDVLANTIEEATVGTIVLLTQPSASTPDLSDQAFQQLEEGLGDLGFAFDDSNGAWNGVGLPAGLSVIGRAGGQGPRALQGIEQSPGRAPGAMQGFLQNSAQTQAGQLGATWVFNWPSTFDQFDTHSGGDDATYNEMTLAGQTYRSETVAAGSSAFHLVWLDGGSLQSLGQTTIPGDQGQELTQALRTIDNQGPSVLFLTTIGHPSIPRPKTGSDAGWATAADLVTAFGGNASAFLALDGSDGAGYSLVGARRTGDYTPNAGLDVSTKLEPQTPDPRVVGVLQRRPAGGWDVGNGGAQGSKTDAGALVPDVLRVLAQPAQPFAPFDGPGEAAAEQYIAERLDIGNTDPTYGIRANYWDPGLDAQWANLKNEIDDPNIVPPCTVAPCSTGFAAVQKQLDIEFDAVAKVRTYFGTYADGTLYEAFNNEFISGQYSFDQISDYILSRYPPQQKQAAGPSPLDVIEGMLDAASELVPEGGEALGVAGAAFELASAFTEGGGSSSYAGATRFDADASQFASTLQQGYTDSLSGLNRVADLLVSDAGRLQFAGDAVLNQWSVDSDDLNGVLDRGISAYMWTSLLPTTMTAYQCVKPPVYFPPEDFRPSPWYPADVKTPSDIQFPIATVTDWPRRTPGGRGPVSRPSPQVNDVGYLTAGGKIAGDFEYLDGGVASNLFAPIDGNPQHLGLLPVYLFAPQPYGGSPGFVLNQGKYDASDSDATGYVRFTCAKDEWREDTNVRGGW